MSPMLRAPMLRRIASVILTTAFVTATPLAVTHAQSTSATVRHDADVAWAKVKGAWSQTKGEVKEQGAS